MMLQRILEDEIKKTKNFQLFENSREEVMEEKCMDLREWIASKWNSWKYTTLSGSIGERKWEYNSVGKY